MQMKKMKFFCAIVLGLFIATSHAQTQRCLNDAMMQKMLTEHPSWKAKFQNQKNNIEQVAAYCKKQSNTTQAKTTNTVTIPVVFHIVLTQAQQAQIGGASGIAMRVDSQMAVLNRDYNGLALDRNDIPAAFLSLRGDVKLQFGLAHTQPDGTGTPGFEIVTTTAPSFDPMTGTTGSTYYASDAKYAISNGADAWDPTKYLNIWIVNFSMNGLLGISPPYSFVYDPNDPFPIAEIGPAINYLAFGKQGPWQTTFLSGFNGGRTLVHELGHTFEMLHIWGNTAIGAGDCNDDDGISDTPQQDDANTSCPTVFKPNCNNTPEGEMYMNYMDYVEDACYRMFTTDQAGVMNYQVTNPLGNAYGLSQHPELLQYPTAVAGMEKETAIQLYPNPTNGLVQVTVAENVTLKKIVVVNVLGQQVMTITNVDSRLRKQYVDLGTLPKGIYQVQCIFAEGQLTKKIILQ
jgi:hypothetical protein